MTVSEFTFLALGLVLGVAAGAALIVVLRARPPAAREVRVTVAQDAVPRRGGSTLSDDAFARAPAEPARGGPADRRLSDADPPAGDVERRTPVRSGVPGAAPAVGLPISQGDDPMLASLRVRATASPAMTRANASTAIMEAPAPRSADDEPGSGAMLGAGPTSERSDGGPSVTDSSGAVAQTTGQSIDHSGPCAEQRRLADERCELAVRARSLATRAEDTLRTAQRTYDDHEARAEEAARAADPRAVRSAKDAAQATFRSGRNAARTTADVEAAASLWLSEVNRINAEARDAAAAAAREREAATALAQELERLGMGWEAARIGAETADAACLAAREAVADCQERAADAATASRPLATTAPGGPFTAEAVPMGALGIAGTPRIFRLLRGDRTAMGELVAAMAGDQADERRRWQLALSDLVDAIVADSIAASSLEFPSNHPFWGPFTVAQSRDIASALSSLGYRFDGLGGWVDGRIPSQRDLSLAVGYAGLDPMRIRQWPTEATMADLFRDVAVAADEHLASAAGDLTLGELVTMLGRRADGLADAWNEWGRLRPLLLEER